MKINREKVQIFLTNCEYSPDVLGLYQTGQVTARTPAPNSACYMQELPNGGPFKIRVYCNQFPILHNRTSKVSTHKLKSRGNNRVTTLQLVHCAYISQTATF